MVRYLLDWHYVSIQIVNVRFYVVGHDGQTYIKLGKFVVKANSE